MNLNSIKIASKIVDYIGLFHRHEVFGMEHIPAEGPCLLVCNHSLATYDIMLLNNEIVKQKNRIPRALMDRWFFKVPAIGRWLNSMGATEGNQTAAYSLLKDGNLVCVAPGGMRESIRSSKDRYKILWQKRKGFVKLAILAQTPIVLAACPNADDIYDIAPTEPLSLFMYDTFKLPFVFLKGVGLTPIPKPVKLVHLVSEPIYPPVLPEGEEPSPKMINEFHRQIVKRMQRLMKEALKKGANK